MNQQDKLKHELTTKIFNQTGIAVDSDDPIVLLTLCNINIIEDKLTPFFTQLELFSQNIQDIDKQLALYKSVAQQVITANSKKEIIEVVEEKILNHLNQMENLKKKTINKFNRNMIIMFFCIFILQLIWLVINMLLFK
jgi:hypothetical protein